MRANISAQRVVQWAVPAAAMFLTACSPSDPQNSLYPTTEIGREIVVLFEQITWWALGVFIVVEAALLFVLYQFRHRRGNKLPRQIHGNTRLEITWTVLPAVVLASIAVPTVQMIFKTYETPTGSDVINVTTYGHQFWWEYTYLDGKVVTASDMVVPVGRTIVLHMTSEDVIHSHWIPGLGVKRDAIPGKVNTFAFKPEQTGIFQGQCTEYCGAQHANMRMRVVVKSQAEFDAWLADQQRPASSVQSPGLQLAIAKGCTGCHAIDGAVPHPTNPPVAAPNLTHFGSRTMVAGGALDNTPANLAAWLRDPQALKPGNKMPDLNLTEAEITTLVNFLHGLK